MPSANENTGKLILLVDDSKDIRDTYAYFLEINGYRVALAADGEEALDKALKIQPDLILMDLSLPGMGGWAATKRLKENQETKHIPIVILTAHSFEAVGTAIKEQSEGFLMKDSVPKEMLKEIARVLNRSR